MRRKNEFLTTGVYSHIFKHNSIQILLKLDDFFRKTYLGKNSVLYWYIKWSSYGVDPRIKIVSLLMLIHMPVTKFLLKSIVFEIFSIISGYAMVKLCPPTHPEGGGEASSKMGAVPFYWMVN